MKMTLRKKFVLLVIFLIAGCIYLGIVRPEELKTIFKINKYLFLGGAAVIGFLIGGIMFFTHFMPSVQKHTWRGRAEPDSEDFRAWLLEQLRALRSLDFFKADRELSDEELRDKILADMEEWGEDLTQFRVTPCYVAQYDPERVFYQDMEEDLCLEESGWIEIIQNWASISRGVFKPENITAKMNEYEKSVDIEFDHGTKHHTTKFKLDGDWLDPGILTRFDEFVEEAGYMYMTEGSDHGQCCFVVVVNDQERRRLRELGWKI